MSEKRRRSVSEAERVVKPKNRSIATDKHPASAPQKKRRQMPTRTMHMSRRKSGEKLCWHCERPGHEKKRCVEWILKREMLRIPLPDGVPDAAKVYTAARACIVKAIEDGKSGRGLRFCGHPDGLSMIWPRGIEPPPYPTPGVWCDGSYMGDDG